MTPNTKYGLLTLLAAMWLLTGCFHEPPKSCSPRTNTTIYFMLHDQAGNDIFPATAEHVELFVYDDLGRQVSHSTISQSELNLFAGKRLRLQPGNYTVVAWANATATRTRFFTNENAHWLDRTNNYLVNAIALGGAVEDGDPLYYAPTSQSMPLTITVPPEGAVEAIAGFRNAHIKVEVTVEGYDYFSTRAAADPLKIELTEITSRYGFGMETHGDRVSYIRYALNTDPEHKIFNTAFNLPVFDRNTATHILVTNKDGRLIVPKISLKEILKDRIEIEKMLYLPIRIKFTEENGLLQVAITVDLPEWGEDIVKPTI